MAINLKKGENTNLTKKYSGETKYRIGLSWDLGVGKSYDLDVCALELTDKVANGGKLINEDYLVGYMSNDTTRPNFNNITFTTPTGTMGFKDPEGAFMHMGDCRDGAADGDDETINIDFSKINPAVKSVLILVTIYDESGTANFGQVKNAMSRLYVGNSEIADTIFELQEDYSAAKCLQFVEFYLHNDEWKMSAIGEGSENNLQIELSKFGI